MFLGYNTNGFAHHRLMDALNIIRALGYDGVAYTPDVNHPEFGYVPELGDGFFVGDYRKLGLSHCVVETGARFILDPLRKHQPTLVSPGWLPRERIEFLKECIDLASKIDAPIVSLWSGSPTDPASSSELMTRLLDGCKQIANYAAESNVRLAFEPEPGMFIDTMDKFAELHAKVNHPAFGLTIDVGHLVCNDELPVSKHLVQWKDWLWNVHIEDMRRGVHDHLMFGEGEVDFDDVFAGLRAAEYRGGVYVELSRHSHDAVNTARRSIEFLRKYLS